MVKKQRRPVHSAPETAVSAPRRVLLRLKKTYRELEPWEPWILASAYLVFMAVLTFRYHPVGYFGVETDFYAELVPQAKKILSGHLSPLNYGAKGPVYSFLLTGVFLAVRDYFYAGLVLNLVSGFVFLAALYHLVRSVFNRATALVTTVAVMFSYTFLSYTYQAGSDLPFMALCALSMMFLFRSVKTPDIVLSALFGLLAFLTRYNGAFIAMGAAIFMALSGGTVRRRIRRLVLWAAVFALAGLPWFIPNYLVTGNPVHNDNHINVLLEFYGSGEGVTYENWTDALPREFTGIGDIILYDPVYFAKHLMANIGGHFISDMKKLAGIPLGVFVVIGFIVTAFAGPGKKQLVYFSFGMLYFLILTLVFYNERFSLYLLAVYFPFMVWPYTEKRVVSRLKRFSALPAAVVMLAIMASAVTSVRTVYVDIANPLPILKDLRALGITLDTLEPDKSQKIIARKPHVSYYAGLVPLMFPGDVESADGLVTFCREHRVRYVLYSGVEYVYRPLLKELIAPGFHHPDLERVAGNRSGVIFRVSGV